MRDVSCEPGQGSPVLSCQSQTVESIASERSGAEWKGVEGRNEEGRQTRYYQHRRRKWRESFPHLKHVVHSELRNDGALRAEPGPPDQGHPATHNWGEGGGERRIVCGRSSQTLIDAGQLHACSGMLTRHSSRQWQRQGLRHAKGERIDEDGLFGGERCASCKRTRDFLAGCHGQRVQAGLPQVEHEPAVLGPVRSAAVDCCGTWAGKEVRLPATRLAATLSKASRSSRSRAACLSQHCAPAKLLCLDANTVARRVRTLELDLRSAERVHSPKPVSLNLPS